MRYLTVYIAALSVVARLGMHTTNASNNPSYEAQSPYYFPHSRGYHTRHSGSLYNQIKLRSLKTPFGCETSLYCARLALRTSGPLGLGHL